MNITSAHKSTLTSITAELEKSGISGDTEVRAKSGGKVLYEKTKTEGRFTSKATRAKKQDDARKLIDTALKNELDDKPGGKVIAGVVRRNLRQIFDGSGAVTKADFMKVKAEADRLHDTFTGYKAASNRLAEDPEFIEGGTDKNNVLDTLPEFNASMDYFEVAELYLSLINGPKPLSADTKRQLGALGEVIKERGSDLNDAFYLDKAGDAMQAATRHGATSVKILPQNVVLRQIGNAEDQAGRCTPMVALVAVAESGSRNGADGVMLRMEQEVHEIRKEDKRGGTDYTRQLGDLHGLTSTTRSKITDSKRREITSLGHRFTVNHLEQRFRAGNGEPVMYGVEVTGHIMMVGASRHGGKDSFIFFDPNFGTARFETTKDLNRFLDDYFGALGYGGSYSMPNLGKDGYDFTVVKEYDIAKVKALTIAGTTVEAMTAPR
ncbi:MAG: YopT-type cysteine protease domain-containing protein [Verrucomicrobium sp.]|nr:YopT-type cysteine protease domain-containing protein [Verrucomicrobium sp.]